MCAWFAFFFNCSASCLSMIVWTPDALGVLYANVLYFCICTCSAQLSMFHMERRSRNMLITVNLLLLLLLLLFFLLLLKGALKNAHYYYHNFFFFWGGGGCCCCYCCYYYS